MNHVPAAFLNTLYGHYIWVGSKESSMVVTGTWMMNAGSYYDTVFQMPSTTVTSSNITISAKPDIIFMNLTIHPFFIDLTQMFGSETGILSALGLNSVTDITANNGAKVKDAFERLFPSQFYATIPARLEI